MLLLPRDYNNFGIFSSSMRLCLGFWVLDLFRVSGLGFRVLISEPKRANVHNVIYSRGEEREREKSPSRGLYR